MRMSRQPAACNDMHAHEMNAVTRDDEEHLGTHRAQCVLEDRQDRME